MIHEVQGDILLSKAQVIIHGVAPNDHFDSGLALSLREQWPAMIKDFRHFCQTTHAKSGAAWLWSGTGGVHILNLLTQEEALGHQTKPGKASTENVNHALRAGRHIIEKEGFRSVALPRLATGVGGLDWNSVMPLIQNHLGDLAIPVYIYTQFIKGKQALEPSNP